MARLHPKKLLVEGAQDKRIIPELIEANGIQWVKHNQPIVYIEEYNGYEALIDPVEIETQLDASGLIALGLIIDADDSLTNRWTSVRNACLPSIPDIPEKLPKAGLIHTAPNGVRFGVWIMPDNYTQGMMETFLACMLPEKNEDLWQYSQTAVTTARSLGAPFLEPHTDKANIYTWLAWQDEPGRQLHQAVKYKILDPVHPKAQAFVNWFKRLYDL